MTRFLLILLCASAVTACAAIEAPLAPPDEPRWYDERAAEAGGREAPVAVPMIEPDAAALQNQDFAAREALAARNAVQSHRRAQAGEDPQSEDFAEDARDRADPDDG